MGMLDTIEKFSDHFKEGEVFTLEDARLGPAIRTDYGNDRPAQLKINGAWYSVFGVALANQVERIDDNDRAAMRRGDFKTKLVRAKTRSGQEVKMLVSPDWTPNGDDIPF